MAPNYKLTYFDGRGIVEPLRLIFAYKGINYEDNRIKKENWPALKPKMPFGKLPILEFDGNVLAESLAITRFIGRQLGLAGKDDLEAAKIDMYIDSLKDCSTQRKAFLLEQDEAKKEEMLRKFFTDVLPPCFDRLEHYLKENGGKHFVGDGVTYCDLYIAHFLCEIRLKNVAIFESYPVLSNHIDYIHSLPQIKAWVEKRPKTEF